MLVGYFPQEWLGILIVGVILSVAIGCVLAFRFPLASSKHIAGAIAIPLCIGLLSVAFDYYHLHALHTLASGEYSTLAKPITGCQALTNYLSDKASGDPITYEGWKQAISDGRCGMGSAITVIISCLFAWGALVSSAYSLATVIRFGFTFVTSPLNNQATSIEQEPEGTSRNDENESPHEKESTTDPSCQVPVKLESKHCYSSMGDSLSDELESLFKGMVGKEQQPPMWDGNILKRFLLYPDKNGLGLQEIPSFKRGFKSLDNNGYLGFEYKRFDSLTHRNVSKPNLIKILEWSAYCADIEFSELITLFLAYRKNELSKSNQS